MKRRGRRFALILGALGAVGLASYEVRHPGEGFALLIRPLYLLGTPVGQGVVGVGLALVFVRLHLRGRKPDRRRG